MSHSNAALTPRHRLKVARLVADDGWPISEVAARFQVSWPAVKRWVDRYLAGESMQDRSSRPRSSPAKTPKTVTKRCVSLRLRLREEPVQLAARRNIAPSTVHRILRSARLNRLAYADRETGEPVRRYEHDHPGSLVHVDVKKLGNIPDGGGWRYVGRHQGEKHRAATQSKSRNAYGGAYRSCLWRDNCETLSITSKFTRPYRPQTNGKVERFHRTMADGRAYARCYTSEQERRDALAGGLHQYNHHRPHTACGNQPPFSRLINVPGQYSSVAV
ncbi:integrase core domain-containing protein [Streptomyces sp. NPDC057499]|uniref:integrase core domain-containing protein n=1 Tax=Streptomyces sp. NPDC057499 TaxID=3346150 RepID=UPI00367F26EC